MGRLRQLARRVAPLPRRVATLPKVVDRFYVSTEWRSLVARIKRERGGWCERCGAGGKGIRIIGDHKHEIKDGGDKLDSRNIELLCAACHNRKTAQVRADRALNQGK